jgi:hypothetical protein
VNVEVAESLPNPEICLVDRVKTDPEFVRGMSCLIDKPDPCEVPDCPMTGRQRGGESVTYAGTCLLKVNINTC